MADEKAEVKELKKIPEETKEAPADNIEKGGEPETNEFLKSVGDLRQGVDTATAEAKKVLKELKEVYQRMQLGGTTPNVEKSESSKGDAKQYARDFMAGKL